MSRGILAWASVGASMLASSLRAQEPIREHLGPAAGGSFGQSVLALADVDGDGADDYAVSDPWTGVHAGTVDVFSGATGGTIFTIAGSGTGTFGSWVGDAGDVDGDGVPDLLVGDPWFDDPTQVGSFEGAVFTYSGRDGALLRDHYGAWSDAFFGASCAGLEDISGDGVLDLLVIANASSSPGGNYHLFGISGSDGAELYEITLDDVDPDVQVGRDRDGDGHRDFVLVGLDVNVDNVLRVCSGVDGAMLFEKTYSGYVVDEICEVDDLDGDGQAEVIVQHYDPTIAAWYVDVLSIATGTVLRTQTPTGLFNDIAAVADQDQDGIREVAYDDVLGHGRSSYDVTLVLRSGRTDERLHAAGPEFASHYSWAASWGALGDVDGDGIGDLLHRHPSFADPTSGIYRGRVRVLSGDDLWLDAEPDAAIANQPLTFTARGTAAGNPMAIVLVDVGGVPTFQPFVIYTADGTEALHLSGLVPSGLSGLEATFQAFAVGRTFRLIASARETVEFL